MSETKKCAMVIFKFRSKYAAMFFMHLHLLCTVIKLILQYIFKCFLICNNHMSVNVSGLAATA